MNGPRPRRPPSDLYRAGHSRSSAQMVAILDAAIDLLRPHEGLDTTGTIREASYLLELLADAIEEKAIGWSEPLN